MTFRGHELAIISDCLISRIQAISDSKGLYADFPAAYAEIDAAIKELQRLNQKICDMM